MRCPSCTAENQPAAKFCIECGAAFQCACVNCGFSNPAAAKFCQECGARLTPPGQSRTEQAPGQSRPEKTPVPKGLSGERRHLTVLFCDLVGSTGIAAQLDPEEWRETVAGYQRAAGEAISRYGGYVAKYLGDGVMAFFGYPEAHENDAERAARAGLAIIEAVARLNEKTRGQKLSVRVGVDSGAVVVGTGAAHDTDVFGDTPNVAARVQEAAARDTVLITEDTHRLLSGLFVVKACGAPALKGVQRRIELYEIVRPSGARGRLEATAAARGLTRFVGREDELRLLMSRWELTLEGEGQVALIIGEAGIGKSRLVQYFHQQIAAMPHTWVQSAAGAFYQNTPFFPIVEMLKQLLGVPEGGSTQAQIAQLQAGIERAGLQAAEAVPLLAPLLDLSVPASYPPPRISAEQQRRRLLAMLVELVLAAARLQPTIIAVEDLHWADPSTLELIQLLVEQGQRVRLFLVCTARPELHLHWPLRAHHTQITLNRLSARNARIMVQEVAAQNALSGETLQTVIERTGGVPLFVEELTRAVLESGDAKHPHSEIPVTLHDSLMARLDRLGDAKEVIQVGAVIGDEFSYELLRAVHPVAEQHLLGLLRKLADAELVYVRGIPPEATYLFKHSLIRDAAYEALLKSRRRQLHRQVAEAIQNHFLPLAQAHPEMLARHFTEAGEIEAAIEQWSKAGQLSQTRHAFKEALESYQKVMALLGLLPPSPQRDLREVELTRAVVWMLQVTRGYSAPETVEAVERSVRLAEKVGNLKQLVNWMFVRYVALYVAGDLAAAAAVADQTFETALREGSRSSVGGAHMIQMFTCAAYREDLAGVERHFAKWVEVFEDPELRQYPGAVVASFGTAMINEFLIGRFDTARMREARLMEAVKGGSPYDQAFAKNYAAALRICLREYQLGEALAAQSLELSEKNQFPLIAANARCHLGYARAQLGRAAEGVALIEQGIASQLEIGTRLSINLFRWRLADAQACSGAIDDARQTLEIVLRENPQECSALTTRGALRISQGQHEPGEADLRRALSLARNKGAKALELRAAMPLATLLSIQGRSEEGRSILREVYSSFSEGFDTADLQEARALLEELGS